MPAALYPTAAISVLRHARIHLVAPGQNAARQIRDVLESRFLQELDRPRAAPASLEVHYDLGIQLQLAGLVPQLTQGDQNRPGNSSVLQILRLAHINQNEPVAPVDLHLQL